MLARESPGARRKTIKGRGYLFLDCSVCGDEYNVSPKQEIGNNYVCPRCFYRSRWVYGR